MIIGSSMVTMQSQRTYAAVSSTQFAKTLSAKRADADDSASKSANASAKAKEPACKHLHSLDELRMFLFEQLTRALEERRYRHGQNRQSFTDWTPEPNSCPSENQIYLPNAYTVQKVQSRFYAEQEVTQFASSGTVQTKDGRSISFDIAFEMNRRFETYEESYEESIIQLCDPIVINYGGPVAELTDQTFYMDLDGDGADEELRPLKEGSGLLALDKNGDGQINDGSELFGTKSGNGFADLAEYDLDKNGWIDEADDIFSKLKVYVKNADGSDKLLSLKEAGVGAIYLDSVRTEFALKNENNDTEAVIKRSGVFLYENGGVGTIQQVDYAV